MFPWKTEHSLTLAEMKAFVEELAKIKHGRGEWIPHPQDWKKLNAVLKKRSVLRKMWAKAQLVRKMWAKAQLEKLKSSSCSSLEFESC